jgi:hypothetical protein
LENCQWVDVLDGKFVSWGTGVALSGQHINDKHLGRCHRLGHAALWLRPNFVSGSAERGVSPDGDAGKKEICFSIDMQALTAMLYATRGERDARLRRETSRLYGGGSAQAPAPPDAGRHLTRIAPCKRSAARGNHQGRHIGLPLRASVRPLAKPHRSRRDAMLRVSDTHRVRAT